MKYKAVFFDAGETLLSPHPSFHEIFAEVAAEQGHTISPQEVEGALSLVAPNYIEVLDKLGETAWSTSREVSQRFWGTVYAVVFDHLEIADPDKALAEALYDRFTRYESYRLFPDSIPALTRVREMGLMLGLISNFEDWLEGMLIEMEVAHLFDMMVISGKEGIEKPDPRIFNIALERSGMAAEDSMYVGDHPRIDAQGAEAVGMTGVLIDRKGRHPDFSGIRITRLDELLPILSGSHGGAGNV
ncbi:MAG TPA: HAD-IA family hydrolase [Actinomycetota bacterium]|nr:HAD-IA family hydrolase [Actinomycetota bacterium]